MYTLIHHTIASALPLWGLGGIAFIDWQPSVEAFTIGSFSVRWYSLLWCIGLLLAYVIVQRLYKQQKIEDEKFEPLFFYCFMGVLVGARLGHCIFYEPAYYLTSMKGFIRAEVIKYDDYIKYGSEAAVREAGKLAVEGKDYVVQDGDIMHFRFNV